MTGPSPGNSILKLRALLFRKNSPVIAPPERTYSPMKEKEGSCSWWSLLSYPCPPTIPKQPREMKHDSFHTRENLNFLRRHYSRNDEGHASRLEEEEEEEEAPGGGGAATAAMQVDEGQSMARKSAWGSWQTPAVGARGVWVMHSSARRSARESRRRCGVWPTKSDLPS